ncbi:hypothetical protein GGP41_008638 [Bipolaris sorokiniana]|uniref:Uncharacterized protein n=1 Tax=Cochliobolus sativus TaxID=45130 RepID=A0A8H5ZB75_COCSA|nr:hypothetical protein GGP41_008638 [Bipolaris sorokiniana]
MPALSEILSLPRAILIPRKQAWRYHRVYLFQVQSVGFLDARYYCLLWCLLPSQYPLCSSNYLETFGTHLYNTADRRRRGVDS